MFDPSPVVAAHATLNWNAVAFLAYGTGRYFQPNSVSRKSMEVNGFESLK